MTDAPEAPQPPPAPTRAPAVLMQQPWFPLAAIVVVVVLVVAGYLAIRAMTVAPGESAYVVQPYTPTTELITGRERVEARAAPDASSPTVMLYGAGVTLNVTGRVSRGLGDDWYAISSNDQTMFVRTQDVVAGTGAPPTPIVRPEAEEEEVDPDKPAEKPDEADLPFPDAPAPEAPAFGLEISDVNWIREPNARDFARFYPSGALDRGQSGRVVLDCVIASGGSLNCGVVQESPGGFGFGQAALSISRQARVQPRLPDGSSAAGRHLRLPISFRAG